MSPWGEPAPHAGPAPHGYAHVSAPARGSETICERWTLQVWFVLIYDSDDNKWLTNAISELYPQ